MKRVINKSLQAMIVSSMLASGLLAEKNVSAETHNTPEVVEEILGNKLDNQSYPEETRVELESAILNHVNQEFDLANDIYTELLNNQNLPSGLIETLTIFSELAKNNENLTKVVIEELLVKENLTGENISETPLENNNHDSSSGDASSEEDEDPGKEIQPKEAIKREKSEKASLTMHSSSASLTAEALYTNVLGSTNATSAWTAALLFIEEAPNHPKLSEAVNNAAQRVYSMGQSNQRKNNVPNALYYYGLIKDEELVNSTDRANATKNYNVLTQLEDSKSADKLYSDVINATTATNAWNAAMDYKKTYPNHSKLADAVNNAAKRIYSMGLSRQRKDDLSNALYYYELILNEELVEATVRANTTKNYNLLTQTEDENTANKLYNKVMNASTATSAWNAAMEYKDAYPKHSKLAIAINNAAQRVYSMGHSNQRKNDTSNALYFYGLIKDEDLVTESLRTNANNAFNNLSVSGLYESVVNAPNATIAWNRAVEFMEVAPNHSKLSEAVNHAAQRIYSMGLSNYKKGNKSSAVHYFELLIDENRVRADIRFESGKYYRELTGKSNSADEARMFNLVVNASTASGAWKSAENFKEIYPESVLLTEAYNRASQRVYSMAQSSQRNNNESNALYYYGLLKDEELINQTIRSNAEKNYNTISVKTLYNSVINASTASNAWQAALEFRKEHPNEKTKLKNAFQSAGTRLYDIGVSNHKAGKFSAAITYYNLLLAEPVISADVKAEVLFFKTQANKKSTTLYADELLNDSITANTASLAWELAHEGLDTFPQDTRFVNAVEQAGNRIYALGVSNHKKGNFTTAIRYYNQFLGSPYGNENTKEKARHYSSLASNRLYLTNVKVEYTKYDQKLKDAISTQLAMKYGKPQISNNGGWRNATQAEVSYYINPKNSLPNNLNDIETNLSQVRIITNILNVRTGPGTNHPIMSRVYEGEVYSISNETNGWYEITLDNETGWISGETIYTQRNNSVLQFLVLSGSSGISVRDLNLELQGAGILSGQGSTFQKASKAANVNELYLISHAILETGYGSSKLATGILVEEVDGKPVKPRIVYNMFGIGAADSAPERLGSEKAYEEGWFSPEEAIIGGAKWISNSYINNATYKQDTLYKMRWNPSSPGTHQYATDVAWATKQTNSLNVIVNLSQKYDLLLGFDVPLYD